MNSVLRGKSWSNLSILALQTVSFLYISKQEEPFKLQFVDRSLLSYENVMQHKQFQTLLSYGFIHLQFDHFLLNQISVFLFANSHSVQQVLRSHSAFFAFYFSSLLIGSLSFLTEQHCKLKYYSYEKSTKETSHSETDKQMEQEMQREYKQKCCGSSAASYALFTFFCNVFTAKQTTAVSKEWLHKAKQRIFPQVKFIPNVFFWMEMMKLVFIPSDQKLDDSVIHMAAIIFGYSCAKVLTRRRM